MAVMTRPTGAKRKAHFLGKACLPLFLAAFFVGCGEEETYSCVCYEDAWVGTHDVAVMQDYRLGEAACEAEAERYTTLADPVWCYHHRGEYFESIVAP